METFTPEELNVFSCLKISNKYNYVIVGTHMKEYFIIHVWIPGAFILNARILDAHCDKLLQDTNWVTLLLFLINVHDTAASHSNKFLLYWRCINLCSDHLVLIEGSFKTGKVTAIFANVFSSYSIFGEVSRHLHLPLDCCSSSSLQHCKDKVDEPRANFLRLVAHAIRSCHELMTHHSIGNCSAKTTCHSGLECSLSVAQYRIYGFWSNQ